MVSVPIGLLRDVAACLDGSASQPRLEAARTYVAHLLEDPECSLCAEGAVMGSERVRTLPRWRCDCGAYLESGEDFCSVSCREECRRADDRERAR